jgi:hypothetical protein
MLRSNSVCNILIVVNLTKSAINNYSLTAQGLPVKDGSYKLQVLYGTEAQKQITVSAGSISNYVPITNLPAYGINIYQVVP